MCVCIYCRYGEILVFTRGQPHLYGHTWNFVMDYNAEGLAYLCVCAYERQSSSRRTQESLVAMTMRAVEGGRVQCCSAQPLLSRRNILVCRKHGPYITCPKLTRNMTLGVPNCVPSTLKNLSLSRHSICRWNDASTSYIIN